MSRRIGGIDLDQLPPAHEQVITGLLAVDQPRPPIDEGSAERLVALIEDGVGVALEQLDDDLWLGKSRLDALVCDGRFLDSLEQPFAWAPRLAVGTLTHRVVELDAAGARRRDLDQLVAHAWEEFRARGDGEATFLDHLDPIAADGLRAEVRAAACEFRNTFPALPGWPVSYEPKLRVRLLGGRLVLSGKPDLLLGSGQRRDARRMMLIDFKTGARYPHHVHEMRFYALLSTLKHRQAPFRVATYYLDEAAWAAEDVTDALLEAAARDVVDKAVRAVRLHVEEPPADELRLVPTAACGWCGRRPTCPAAQEEQR